MVRDWSRGWIFLSTPHTHDRIFLRAHLSFMNVDFFLECSHFDCWRPPYCDVISVAFNDVIAFSDVNLNDSVRDVCCNQYISSNENSCFYLTLGTVRISILGLNPAFPYLVCKNISEKYSKFNFIRKYVYFALDDKWLTHFSLETPKKAIDKQCRLR